MSLQKIINPYDIHVPEEAKAAGFCDRSFPNKAEARSYVKEIRKVCPDFDPSLRIFFRYYDSCTGKLYIDKQEYERDQQHSREFHERMDAERRKRDQEDLERFKNQNGPLVPSESYLKERGY